MWRFSLRGLSDDGDAIIFHRRFLQAAHRFGGRWKNLFRRNTRIAVTRFACATRHRVRRCVRDWQQRRDKRQSHKEAQKAQDAVEKRFVPPVIPVSHELSLRTRLFRNRFSLQFHFALWTGTAFFRGHVLVHRTDIMKLSGFFRVSRMCLLCRRDANRINADPGHKQGGREKRQESKP